MLTARQIILTSLVFLLQTPWDICVPGSNVRKAPYPSAPLKIFPTSPVHLNFVLGKGSLSFLYGAYCLGFLGIFIFDLLQNIVSKRRGSEGGMMAEAGSMDRCPSSQRALKEQAPSVHSGCAVQGQSLAAEVGAAERQQAVANRKTSRLSILQESSKWVHSTGIRNDHQGHWNRVNYNHLSVLGPGQCITCCILEGFRF